MGLLQNPKQFIISLFFLNLLITPHYSSDHTNYVYKGCANQKFQDPSGIYSQNLNNLFNTLSFQSSSVKFYKTTAGQGQTAINGLFQCRGDLSNSDCKDCVSKIPGMSQKLCGGDVVAARIQLEGCYLRYEIAGFKQVSSTELLFKICGDSTQASGGSSDFQQKLDTAFGEVDKGIGGGNGFYSGESQALNVLGQCEEDLGSGGDCVNCVKTAAQKAKSECVGAISAQIYLQQCYITYTYGVPTKFTTSSGRGRIGQDTQKTIAIVFGGIVAVGLVFACLLCARSVYNKRRQHTKHGVEGYY